MKRSDVRDTGYQAEDVDECNCFGLVLIGISWLVVILTFPVAVFLSLKTVQEYERAIIFRLGRAVPDPKGPGLFFIIPCTDNMVRVDLRTVSFDVPPQEILTKDSVTVTVDAVVYYKIQDPMISVVNVEDAPNSTKLLAQTTLRNTLGMKTLSEILSDREHISTHMKQIIDIGTDPWGVKVERVEIKDVRLPEQLQRSMAAEAEAAREARAKVIAAEGEQNASRALKDAADVINQSPCALQLRYLQTLTTISAEKNSTVVFPVPMNLVQGMTGIDVSSSLHTKGHKRVQHQHLESRAKVRHHQDSDSDSRGHSRSKQQDLDPESRGQTRVHIKELDPGSQGQTRSPFKDIETETLGQTRLYIEEPDSESRAGVRGNRRDPESHGQTRGFTRGHPQDKGPDSGGQMRGQYI